jgi:hypothetical protein
MLEVIVDVDEEDAVRIRLFVQSTYQKVIALIGNPYIPVRSVLVELKAPSQLCQCIGNPELGVFRIASTCGLSDYSLWGQLCHQTVHLWDCQVLDVYLEGFAVWFTSIWLPAHGFDWTGWEDYYRDSPGSFYSCVYHMMRELIDYLRPYLLNMHQFICEGSNSFRYFDFGALLGSLPPERREPLRAVVLRHAAAIQKARQQQLPECHFVCPSSLPPSSPTSLPSAAAASVSPIHSLSPIGRPHTPAPLATDWTRYEGLEDDPAVIKFLDGALRGVQAMFGTPAIEPRCIHVRLSSSGAPTVAGAKTGFQRCDLINRGAGEFCIYLSRRVYEYAFFGQFAHEVGHLINAEVHDAYAEGTSSFFPPLSLSLSESYLGMQGSARTLRHGGYRHTGTTGKVGMRGTTKEGILSTP